MIPALAALFTGCGTSSSSARRVLALPRVSQGITRIDAEDTAAYAEAGPEAIAAVARCRPPACWPDIFRGPGPGELTVGLDSPAGRPRAEYQWHIMHDTLPAGGQEFQESSWAAMLTKWEAARPRRLLLIDSVPRTFAYAREHVSLSSVWGIQEISAKEAQALSSDPAAANGAVLITTKAHVAASPAGRTAAVGSPSSAPVVAGRRCRPSSAPSSTLQADTIVIGEAPLVYDRIRPTPRVPRYPVDEKQSGVEGRVLSSFVIDTLGRVIPGSELITEETARGFGDAVCAYLRSVRFIPMESNGRRITLELRDQLTTFALTR